MKMDQISNQSFCLTQFWDFNLTWNSQTPDFTPCFHKTALVYIPCIFLWVLALVEVYFIKKNYYGYCCQSLILKSKYFVSICIIFLALVELINQISLAYSERFEIVGADYVAPIVKFFTYILSLVLMYFSSKSGRPTSAIQFFFWLITTFCQGFTFTSVLVNENPKLSPSTFSDILIILNFLLALILLVLNCLAEKKDVYADIDEKAANPSPERSCSFIKRILFIWFEPMILKFRKETVNKNDLWDLNINDRVDYNYSRWTRIRLNNGFITSFLLTFIKEFSIAGIFILAFSLSQLSSPQLLSLLIGFIQDKNAPLWHGFLFAILLPLTTIIGAIGDSNYWYLVKMLRLRTKALLSAAIYRKTLRLSSQSRRKYNTGEIVNLMSVDAHKIGESCLHINTLWASPFQVIFAGVLLYFQIGFAVFAGIMVMILFFSIASVFFHFTKINQEKQMKKKDERVHLITEILSGIKGLKLYAWEKSFVEKITQIRNEETGFLKTLLYQDSFQYFVWCCAPYFVAFSSFAAYILSNPEQNILDTKTAFVSLALFNLIRIPFFLIPEAITFLIQGYVSCRRVEQFLSENEIDVNTIEHQSLSVSSEDSYQVSIDNSSFGWDSKEAAILKNISLKVNQGSLVAVVGAVGSGKSSLISAILGEMEKFQGDVSIKGNVAYVPQQAWILNTSFEENILFGKEYEEQLFDKVIDSCALNPDIAMLPGGTKTEIGEKGINLSGGQKQRLSLARAVYNDADVFLLDDPLSAVDSHVGKHLFLQVIGPEGILKNKTRILVTHSINYLSEMDQIVVMKNGEISELGTYDQLIHNKGAFAEFMLQQMKNINYSSDSDSENEITRENIKHDLEELFGIKEFKSDSVDKKTKKKFEETQLNKSKHKLIEEESYETGRVGINVYLSYFKNFGTFFSFVSFLSFALFHSLQIGGNIWLSKWSQDEAAIKNVSTTNFYLGIYALFGLLQSICVLLGAIAITKGSIKAAKSFHYQLLDNILRSTMEFFDTTPLGRIVNRFSKDIDEIDFRMPENIKDVLVDVLGVSGTLIIIFISAPILIILIIPITIISYLILTSYLTLSRQLKRMVSVSTSPINQNLSETYNGASSIRAYNMTQNFIEKNDNNLEVNNMFYYPEMVSDSWLYSRIQIITVLLIGGTAIMAVIYKDTFNAGILALCLTYAFNFQLDTFLAVLHICILEKSIVSVERVKEYQNTPKEAEKTFIETNPISNWPKNGKIEFKSFSTRYREGLDLVLNDLSFIIEPQEKIGIVGRTGAGKSSLTLSLFRIIESTQGSIEIDGLDIEKISLNALRNGLTIIPQDPILFSGTMRFNLDPFQCYSDEEIWIALEHAHLKEFVTQLPHSLDHIISDGGDNLSVGQRQLVCLARALLKKTKILILDEATAAVDMETDDFIQTTIKTEFNDCTILTIAHRIKTILDSTKVLVLESGTVKEFDQPEILLSNTQSTFYSLAKESGLI